MKVTKSKTYHLRNDKKVLNSLSYVITSGNKTFSSYYSIRNGKLSKTTEERKIGDKYVQAIRYNKSSISKTNYYYHSSGQLKRWETLVFGGVQQYRDSIFDKKGNLISGETEDSYIFYEKMVSEKTNRSCTIEYIYDKYTEPIGAPIEEGMEVKIFEGPLITHLIEYEDDLKTYRDLEEIRSHYKNFEHVKRGTIDYTDFSGALLNIPKPDNHYETHYEYHENNILKKEIKYFCSNRGTPDGVKQNKVISETNYNDKGSMVSRINENKEITRQELKYNEEGSLVEVKVLRNDKLISVFLIEKEILDHIEEDAYFS